MCLKGYRDTMRGGIPAIVRVQTSSCPRQGSRLGGAKNLGIVATLRMQTVADEVMTHLTLRLKLHNVAKTVKV
jgi:hypothetical protein